MVVALKLKIEDEEQLELATSSNTFAKMKSGMDQIDGEVKEANSPLAPEGGAFDLICVGRGTSAAAYLTNLKRSASQEGISVDQQLEVLAIGKDDPWAGARGYEKGKYSQCINQAEQFINPGEGKFASSSIDPVDRMAFAATNKKKIENAALGNVLDAEVQKIERDEKTGLWKIQTDATGNPLMARKVVLATGAGIETTDSEYHYVPPEVAQFRETGGEAAKRIMDLDQFQKGHEGTKELKDSVVTVLGPNAGTDAVMELATRNVPLENVNWMMGKNDTPGTALTWDVSSKDITPTFTAEQASLDRGKGGPVHRYNSKQGFEISAGKEKALAIKTDAGVFETDYLVYATGQRGGGINRAVGPQGKVTQVPMLEKGLAAHLEPVYDVNQRFSDLYEYDGPHKGGAWQHVVGLQLKGTTSTDGLEVIGAAAMQAARDVKHNYMDDELCKLQDMALKSPAEIGDPAKKWLPEIWENVAFSNIGDAKVSDDYAGRKEKLLELLEGKLKIKEIEEEPLKQLKELIYTFELRQKAAADLGADAAKNVSSALAKGLQRTQPVTVADPRLIYGAQLNIAAQTESFKEEQITTPGGINYNEDQQTIAMYIAQVYPYIPRKTANEFVAELIKKRTDGKHLRGFTGEDRKKMEGVLIRLNAKYEKIVKDAEAKSRSFRPKL
ncbi:Effector protein HopAD1 [Pseudovibrio sp. FO-BEG1]|nr:Effector protein HopAD1 [Pseudovibrio sp. FO-BEG1]